MPNLALLNSQQCRIRYGVSKAHAVRYRAIHYSSSYNFATGPHRSLTISITPTIDILFTVGCIITPTRDEFAPTSRGSLSPPDSAEMPPRLASPLPSTLAYVLNLIRTLQEDLSEDSRWEKVTLKHSGHYSKLITLLREEGLEEKTRFDYDPNTLELIFRMATTPTHDIFTEMLMDRLKYRISQLNADPLALSIVSDGTSRVILRDDPSLQESIERSPDASLRHRDAAYPSVVFETSYTQKRKDMWKLAENYIIGSGGNIQMVIGCDIEYRLSKEATVSVWKPEAGLKNGQPYLAVKQVINADRFRYGDSSRVQTDAAIEIPLSYFALPDSTKETTEIISITYAELYEILHYAEHRQKMKEGQGAKRILPSGTVVKRKREQSPDE